MKNSVLLRRINVFLLLLSLLYTNNLSAQTVTEVVTDFNGYWRSGVRPNTNGVHPNNSHNLVSFTLSGTRFSTGVNDAILTSNGLAFTAGNYKALPITALSVAPTTST
ncbi:MAG: hypothetical protein H7Y31_04565, partial [Chitinophagaceae bacterium]|nr:hypothetical protein [Chitinophagaceae bacterium]